MRARIVRKNRQTQAGVGVGIRGENKIYAVRVSVKLFKMTGLNHQLSGPTANTTDP